MSGVTRPERLVEITRVISCGTADVSYPVYRYLRGQTTVLEDVAALELTSVSVSTGDEPAVRGALVVTGNYFALLGTLADDEPSRGLSAVMEMGCEVRA